MNVYEKTLRDYLEEHASIFSKGQRKIADFLLHSPKAQIDMTAKQIASLLNISESTVVRFAQEIGLKGYRELQELINEQIKSTHTTLDRWADSSRDEPSVRSPGRSSIDTDLMMLRKLRDQLDEASLLKIVDALNNAPNLYLLGCRSSHFLAEYFHFYLRLIRKKVVLLGEIQTTVHEEMDAIEPGDTLFVLSFPRYTKATTEVAALASERGAHVIAFTDNKTSRLAHLSDEILVVDNNILSFIDSMVAPMALLNAVIVELAMRNRQQTINTLSRMEKVWKKYRIFEGEDS